MSSAVVVAVVVAVAVAAAAAAGLGGHNGHCTVQNRAASVACRPAVRFGWGCREAVFAEKASAVDSQISRCSEMLVWGLLMEG